MGELPTLPAEAMKIVTRDQIDRGRATRKLRDVLARAASGTGETASIRTISVMGSYARGALRVGDIDLTIEVDDPRDERNARLDDFYRLIRGRNPDRPVLRELRCSGSSIVSAVLVRRFGEQPEPVPPEQWRDDLGPDYELAAPPSLGHIVTNQPMAGPSHLLYVRGDSVATALERLAAIKEDPDASRFERTTGVPMLDALIDQVGVSVQYKLADLVKSGGLNLEAVVLESGVDPPDCVVRFEAERGQLPGGKARRSAVVAAIDHLLKSGVEDHRISMRGISLIDNDFEDDVLLDWGTMTLFAISDRLRFGCSQVLVVLQSHRNGPWVGLNCSMRDQPALEEAEAAEMRRVTQRMNADIDLGLESES
jgi:hypothetical protein